MRWLFGRCTPRWMSSSAPESSVTEIQAIFTCFSQLPVELRLIIWEMCMPAGRIIIARSFIGPVLEYRVLESDAQQQATYEALLLTNKEASRVAQRFYPHRICQEWPVPDLLFNPKIDTLLIDWRSMDTLLRCNPCITDFIEHLIIELPRRGLHCSSRCYTLHTKMTLAGFQGKLRTLGIAAHTLPGIAEIVTYSEVMRGRRVARKSFLQEGFGMMMKEDTSAWYRCADTGRISRRNWKPKIYTLHRYMETGLKDLAS